MMAPDSSECRVYERIAGAGVEGGIVRPGGMGLTRRALGLCGGFRPGSRVLDVGCGTGATVKGLIEAYGIRAVGLDPSFAMLACGRAANASLLLVRATGESLPFPDLCFDGILAECSLSLSRDPGAVLRECRRVLRRGGKLVLTDVYARNAAAVPGLRAVSPDCCLAGAAARDELADRLERSGFAVRVWEDHTPALKYFAARLILSGENAPSFWCAFTGAAPADAVEIGRAVSRARVGYFLAVSEAS